MMVDGEHCGALREEAGSAERWFWLRGVRLVEGSGWAPQSRLHVYLHPFF